jgi:hypothetical protein
LLYKKDPRCKIRILLVDPRSAMIINFEQVARIVKNYKENLEPILQLENSQLELGFYSSPPSLRGRIFDGEFLQLSWYTFVPRPESKDTVVQGETNPSVAAYEVTMEGHLMKDFFCDHFEKLWKARIAPDVIDNWIEVTYDDITRRFRDAASV